MSGKDGKPRLPLGRREFVFTLMALSSAPPPGLARTRGIIQASTSWGFDREEHLLMEAICEQILPQDEFPGARELAVVDFLVKTLLGSHPDWRGLYRAGLEATRRSSKRAFDREFWEVSFDDQTSMLERMEAGKLDPVDWREISSRDFFRMVRDHTLQGAYSHPRYGGNRDRKAWKMIGYDDWWSND